MTITQGIAEKKRLLTRNMYRLGEKRAEQQRRAEFIRQIDDATQELQHAHNNFNFATDAALLEYYIYEIKAAETKLNYYLRRAKAERIVHPGYFPPACARHGERSVEL